MDISEIQAMVGQLHAAKQKQVDHEKKLVRTATQLEKDAKAAQNEIRLLLEADEQKKIEEAKEAEQAAEVKRMKDAEAEAAAVRKAEAKKQAEIDKKLAFEKKIADKRNSRVDA